MKARQKGKQNSKRELEIKYIQEAREAIKNYKHRSWVWIGTESWKNNEGQCVSV
ncbi:hypothetical protein QGX17_gp007 [Pseudomonas phage phiPsa381]|uniref:Uncharacterized protein n=2 Tax=Otagovirus TaxID=2560197 RepID=A0A7G9V348_9CAUD|nr:hypothetical protein QGX16_gp008 [Pseudomonas phage phiPsa397]YP_010767270.1 hypothetical protein QGX17_gp007 [Pseudomonas phage phiPsa381]QNO00704.1 hypothetical protein phiPsa381_007 [Pseudomonas phage phiPsa381]QNO00877.1 hypothetical protein phiPsa397_008 [Pseudomonas phage phiPsa397]